MKKICLVTTTDLAVKAFLIGHIRELSREYAITVITNTNNTLFLSELGINAKVVNLQFARNINLLSDIYCLFSLIAIFARERYDAVHSVTPKAGLLTMLASLISFIPVRIHTFTGQVWANKIGFKRYLLKSIDRFFSRLATHIIIDSPSQMNFLQAEKIISINKCNVFGAGSIAGVDLEKFRPDSVARQTIRTSLNISHSSLIFLFIGRLNQDKGVLDLAKAYIEAKIRHSYLVFVGPDEQGMKEKITSLQGFEGTHIKFVSYTNTPEQFMAASDVLCLPSYREGFGNVIIEAAACGLPSIASKIYGITDAVIDKKTGLLHTPHNIAEITENLKTLAVDAVLRDELARNAYRRVSLDFNAKIISQHWCSFYKKIFDDAC